VEGMVGEAGGAVGADYLCMFSRRELLDASLELAQIQSPPLELVHFDQFAFHSPASEQAIWSIGEQKPTFQAEFWAKALQAQDWDRRADYFLPYLEQSKCASVTYEGLFRLVAEYSCTLGPPLPAFVRRREGFVADDWNDVAAVAEFVDDFVAFFWSTTACLHKLGGPRTARGGPVPPSQGTPRL